MGQRALTRVQRPARRVTSVSERVSPSSSGSLAPDPGGHLHFDEASLALTRCTLVLTTAPAWIFDIADKSSSLAVLRNPKFWPFLFIFPLLQCIDGYVGLDWEHCPIKRATTPPPCLPGYREPPSPTMLSLSRLLPFQASSLEAPFLDFRKLDA